MQQTSFSLVSSSVQTIRAHKRQCYGDRRPEALRSERKGSLCATTQRETTAADTGKATENEVDTAQQSGQEIYLGFDKSDSTPRSGRKGRVLRDDPRKYPDKDALTGGWAGGEIGLQQFIAEQQNEETVQKAKVIDQREWDGRQQTVAVTEDGEAIYIGFSKSEIDARKAGQRGQYIRDDVRKYPDKENVGPIPGITGGFAGGERGLQQFIETGDIKLSEKGKPQFSSILVAALVAGGVTTGAILLNSGVLLSEQAWKGLQPGAVPAAGGSQLIIDQNTKLLLKVALGLAGAGAFVIGARAFASRFQESTVRLKDEALNIGKIAAFWIAVLIAALYIIDSQ